MTEDRLLFDVADLFKMFADSTRLRIMSTLYEGELSVGDISARLNMNQSAISHQLKILKSSKLVKNRREGKIVFYSLDDDHVYNIIAQGIEHVSE